MEFDALRAAVVPGGGVVGRWPGLICVAECEDRAVLRRLLDVCASTAGPDPGRTVARRLAMWLGGPDAPGSGLRFGTVAISGDQWAVFLFGSVGLVVPGSGIELSGADAATWTDRLLSRQDTPGVLVLEGSTVPADLVDGVHDLRSGVVPGAGAVLVQVRRNGGGDTAQDIAPRRTADPAWPELVDIPGELERSPWSMTDTGPLATSRPTYRRPAAGLVEDSPIWRGVLGGGDVLAGDVLSGDLPGGDNLGGDHGDTRSGGDGSATGRVGSGLSGAGWPTNTRRTDPDRSGGPSGARRGRTGRSGASRGGLGSNGSVLRAVGSRDFESPERGGPGERANRDDPDGGRAEDSGPPGAASAEDEASRLGSRPSEPARETSAVDASDPAAATASGLSGSAPPAADRGGGAREAEAGRTGSRPVGDADSGRKGPERGESGTTTGSRAAEAQLRPLTRREAGGAGKGRGAPGGADPGGAPGAGEPGAVKSGAGEPGADTSAGGVPASGSADAGRADSGRPDSGRAVSDGADAGRAAAGGELGSAASGRAGSTGAGLNRGGANGAGSNRPGVNRTGATAAGTNGAGSNRTGSTGAGLTGAGPNGAGSNRAGSTGAGLTGAGPNGAGLTGAGSTGAGSNGPGSNGPGSNGPGSNGAGVNRAGSNGAEANGAEVNRVASAGAGLDGAGSNGAGSNGAVANGAGAGSNGSKQNAPLGRADSGRAPRGGDTGRAGGSGGAAPGAASTRTGSGRALPRGGEGDRRGPGGPGTDRGEPGRGPSDRSGSAGTGKAEARRGFSGGGPRSADLGSADPGIGDPGRAAGGRAGESPADQGRADRDRADRDRADRDRADQGRADQGRADQGGADAGPGGQADARAAASVEAGSGGGVAVVSRLVPRDQAGRAATPAVDQTSVGSVHPLADIPRRTTARVAESAQPESDQWFAASTDIGEAAPPERQGRPRHGRPEEEEGGAAQKSGGDALAQAAHPDGAAGSTTQTQLRAERVLGVVQAEPARPQESEPATVGVPTGDAATTSLPSSAPAEAHPDPTEPPQVRGHLCPRGHLNDPRAQFCLSCGARVEERGGALVSGARPPLGMLIFDDGATRTVDADHLVGRMPEADPRVRAGSLRSLLIEDPSGAVSRVHAEIRLNGWDVLLVDSGSRNGTFVAGPGESAWTPLPARQSRWLVPGTRVRLGGRTFLFEAPPGVR
jgi:hypothetical protein